MPEVNIEDIILFACLVVFTIINLLGWWWSLLVSAGCFLMAVYIACKIDTQITDERWYEDGA